ncbi:hypothetical protein BC936DRAFT_147327 [Jimgerdemannia flammicorona]|uniref:Uncharacterized protein n=1 Tax=Jimgerdemannia flammicorona TaxID=994334 RepID=A0A433DL57_9FUNG|nr:hypothetical protein BC936DRAFT_147327 [Jimgerdemannia flammicorona]
MRASCHRLGHRESGAGVRANNKNRTSSSRRTTLLTYSETCDIRELYSCNPTISLNQFRELPYPSVLTNTPASGLSFPNL